MFDGPNPIMVVSPPRGGRINATKAFPPIPLSTPRIGQPTSPGGVFWLRSVEAEVLNLHVAIQLRVLRLTALRDLSRDESLKQPDSVLGQLPVRCQPPVRGRNAAFDMEGPAFPPPRRWAWREY